MNIYRVTVNNYSMGVVIDKPFQSLAAAQKFIRNDFWKEFPETTYGDIRSILDSGWGEYRGDEGKALGEVNLDSEEVVA